MHLNKQFVKFYLKHKLHCHASFVHDNLNYINMRKRDLIQNLVLAVCILLYSIQLQAQQKIIRIKGSDTMLPLSIKEAEGFMKKNKEYQVLVNGGGSNTGINELIQNSIDICMASRKMKESEKNLLISKGQKVKEVIVAIDALAIIVNPNNKISTLTRDDLQKIYTGVSTNWKEFGGEDVKIVVLSREASSGTHVFFQEHVLLNNPFGPSTIFMPNTESIVEQVSQTRGAIGYVGHAYIDKGVKTLSISYDNGLSYYEPTIENVRNHTYPVSRQLYYYYTESNEEKVKPFIDYVLSEEGQKIVFLVGYVPVK